MRGGYSNPRNQYQQGYNSAYTSPYHQRQGMYVQLEDLELQAVSFL